MLWFLLSSFRKKKRLFSPLKARFILKVFNMELRFQRSMISVYRQTSATRPPSGTDTGEANVTRIKIKEKKSSFSRVILEEAIHLELACLLIRIK